MNQSLALLYKDPSLAEELHDDIRELSLAPPDRSRRRFTRRLAKVCASDSLAEELVKAERGDISELMTTSFSETRTTEELVPAESEEEKDDEEEEEKAFQNRPYPPHIGIYCPFSCIFLHFYNYRLHKNHSILKRISQSF